MRIAWRPGLWEGEIQSASDSPAWDQDICEVGLVFLRALEQRKVVGTMFGFLSNDSKDISSNFPNCQPESSNSRSPMASHWHNVRVLIQ